MTAPRQGRGADGRQFAPSARSLMSGNGVLAALQSRASTRMPSTRPSARCRAEARRLRARASSRCTAATARTARCRARWSCCASLHRLGRDGLGDRDGQGDDQALWLAEGLPTPRWLALPRPPGRDAHRAPVPDELGLPLIVKPPREGSSIGVTKVRATRMRTRWRWPRSYDADVLCEEFIDGDEVTCPVLGTGASAHALPVIRIVRPRATTTTRTSTSPTSRGYLVPERPAAEAEEEARSSASCWAAYRALGCRGWGRADLMIRASDRQALPAGDEHLAGHDRPFAGADVGPPPASATSSCACTCWRRRAGRPEAAMPTAARGQA